jgi:hypothetical protein
MVVGYLVTIRCDLLDLCTPDTLHLSSHFAIYLAPVLANSLIACTYYFFLRRCAPPRPACSDEAGRRRTRRDTDAAVTPLAGRAEVRVACVEL